MNRNLLTYKRIFNKTNIRGKINFSQFKEIIYAIVGLYKKASFQDQTRDHEKMPNNKFKSAYSNSFNVFSMIPIASINCSSLITKGGAETNNMLVSRFS